jgi:hypothetical protein
LRTRFQPVTAARVARQQLDGLRQGNRGINDYIAEFQRLHALLPGMAQEDALYAFERGVGPTIALELRKVAPTRLTDAIALAARIGGLAAAASASAAPPSRGASANQMEVGGGEGASLDERIERAVLNAIQAQQGVAPPSGLGAKTQTQRGYAQERGARGNFGSRVGGRRGPAERISSGGEIPRLPKVPGVSPAVVEQRRTAGQCYRCGSSEHTRFECTNASSASASHSSN